MTRAKAIPLHLHTPSAAPEASIALFVLVILVAKAALLFGWIGLGR